MNHGQMLALDISVIRRTSPIITAVEPDFRDGLPQLFLQTQTGPRERNRFLHLLY